MNLYLITRNKKPDYPAYDKAIVAAQSADEATKIIEADADNWTEVYINRKISESLKRYLAERKANV